MPRRELLDRHPSLLLHQVDETEVAGTEHDDVAAGDVVLLRLRLPPRRLGRSVTDHRLLLVAANERADAAIREVPLDELVEAVAVPLLEGRPLRLSVVGEDDERVRPCGVAAGAFDAGELLVELPQRLERVLSLEPRMVRDLVVARERRVDRGPPLHHVGEDAIDDQVAGEHAHRRPQEGIDAAPVPPRPDVASPLSRGRAPLQEHLPAEEDERPRDVEPVGEKGAVARVGPALRLHPADGEDHVVGAAGEEVPAACAAVREEARSDVVPPLDLGAILRGGARDDLLPLLLDPAEGGDVVVRAKQDPGLGGARLRGEVGLPLGEHVRAVRKPARHGRRMPVAHGPLEHRQSEPVDLEEDDPRLVGHDPLARAPRDSLHDAQRIHVVVVGAEQHGQDDAHCGCGKGNAERRPEGVDRQAGAEPARQEQHPGVDEQHEKEAEQGREREPQRSDERRQHRVEQGDERRRDEGGAEGRVRRAGDELRRDEQRDGAEQPPEHELPEPEARPLGLQPGASP